MDVSRLSARVFILTLSAMIAFAGNSLLCRLALKQTAIDAASFTFIRILSGATALWLIMQSRRVLLTHRTASRVVERFSGSSFVAHHSSLQQAGNQASALALFAYAAAFSFAYLSLSAATGALLLFGAVQATMILWGLRSGERLRVPQFAGFTLALAGLVALLFPGLTSPPLSGSILMLGAGVAWGIYSIRGKAEQNPTSATAGNFLRAVPWAAVLSIATLPWARIDLSGSAYAILSGAIASGLGYVVWYAALPDLRATNAATVQLSVPVLAATGGIILLGEPITVRFCCASMAVLGGIALFVTSSPRREAGIYLPKRAP